MRHGRHIGRQLAVHAQVFEALAHQVHQLVA